MSATSFEYNRSAGRSIPADAPNAIGGGGSVTGETPNAQPSQPGFWNNAGVPTWFNGTDNISVDVVSGSSPNSTIDEAVNSLPILP